MTFYEHHRLPPAIDSRRRSPTLVSSTGSNIISMGPFLNRNVSIVNIQGFLRSKNCRGVEKIDIDGDYAFITFIDTDCAFQAVKACHGEKFFQSPVQVRQLSLSSRDPENHYFSKDFGPTNDAHLRSSLALQHHHHNQNAGGFPMSGPSFGTLGNFEMPNLSLPPPLMPPPRRPNLIDELPQPMYVPISSPEHSRDERDSRQRDRTKANEKNIHSSTREGRNSDRKSNKVDSKKGHSSSNKRSSGKTSHTDRKSAENSKKIVDDKKLREKNEKEEKKPSESNKRKSYASSDDKNEKRDVDEKKKRPRSETSNGQQKNNHDESSPPKITKPSTPKSQESKVKDSAEVSNINSAYGQVIAGRLEKLDEKQQAYVKLKIEEIFFAVEFGSLPPASTPTVAPSFPTILNAGPQAEYANAANQFVNRTFNLTDASTQGQAPRERRSRY